ncbi:MAG: DNA polymerase IV [Cryobacterium sp.]|nr:DNA polymerase IV [Oligoflexia bacterium]
MIFHLDLDSFFVSCERLKDPSLIGIPVATGGKVVAEELAGNRDTGSRADPRGAGGVISSASYEARKFGVRSAMPTAQALRLCPHLKIIRSSFGLYSEMSKKVFTVVERFAPVLEKVSVDEAYLDMRGTENLWGPPEVAAQTIRAAVFEETGLTASIGIGSNRRVAKIATDFRKPNGQTYVAPGTEIEFLAPLDLKRIPGIGPSTEAVLTENGLLKIRDAQAWPLEKLVARFGEGMGHFLFRASRGEGSTAFFEEALTRSMSRERTFSEFPKDRMTLKKELWTLVSEIGAELREEEDPALKYAQTVRLKLRNPKFETISRSRVLSKPTKITEEIFDAVLALFEENWMPGSAVRLLGAGIVLGDGARQLGLFEPVAEEQKKEKLEELKDTLRAKFGDSALKTGRDF